MRPGAHPPPSDRTTWRRATVGGVSMVELLWVVAFMSIFVLLVLPTAHTIHRRQQEKELRRGLVRIRTALDDYHRDWEFGYIEADTDTGWPESLEALTEEVEYRGPTEASAQPIPVAPGQPPPQPPLGLDEEPQLKVYLERIPPDPFNRHGDEWDTGGWKARSYEDDFDSTSWGGDDVYDVYSSSELTALDGSTYSEW